MKTQQHFIPNGDGFRLSLHQTWDEARLDPDKRPVLVVPGYGMNSFIFSYHPRGASLEGFFAARGFEVFRVDLREQGETISDGGREAYGIRDLAMTDLGAAIAGVLAHTRSRAQRVDVIGCSLGGTFMFVHAAVNPSHRMGAMVAMGAPVRWVKVHPLVRAAFAWPTLVGAVRFRGTRKLAGAVLPELVRRAPWLLSVYLNPEITDTEAAREMVRTVEDPNRYVNKEIARWIHDKDLVIRGVNVSEAMAELDNPLLCVLANGDGIVPRETAAFPFHAARSRDKALLEVGTDTIRLAHADMFVSNEAHARVFAPIAGWLSDRAGSAHAGATAPSDVMTSADPHAGGARRTVPALATMASSSSEPRRFKAGVVISRPAHHATASNEALDRARAVLATARRRR